MPGTLLIIAGQFDLSVASIIALSGVAMATAAEGHPMPLAIVVAFAVGSLAGAVNGFLVTVVGVNALITTLGMLSVLSGLARVIADGLSVSVQDFSTLGTARPLGVPLPVVIFLAVVGLFSFVGRFTTFGRSVYAIGSNPTAARLAGHPDEAHDLHAVPPVRPGMCPRRPDPDVDARFGIANSLGGTRVVRRHRHHPRRARRCRAVREQRSGRWSGCSSSGS